MRFLLFLLLLTYWLNVFSQKSTRIEQQVRAIHEEMREVNQITLRNQHTGHLSRCFEHSSYDFWFDGQSRLRKLKIHVAKGCTKENFADYIEYFDEDGFLLFHFFSILLENDHGQFTKATGKFYFKEENLIEKEVKWNNDIADGSIDTINLPQYYSPGQKRSDYCLHINTEQAKSQFSEIQEVLSPKFELAEGSLAFINNNGVSVRREPKINGRVVGRLMAFDRIRIMEKGVIQKLDKWGTHNWFRIIGYSNVRKKKVEGWIFGVFLEPIQQTI